MNSGVTFWKVLQPRENTSRFIQEYWIRVIWSVMCKLRKPYKQNTECKLNCVCVCVILLCNLDIWILAESNTHQFSNGFKFYSYEVTRNEKNVVCERVNMSSGDMRLSGFLWFVDMELDLMWWCQHHTQHLDQFYSRMCYLFCCLLVLYINMCGVQLHHCPAILLIWSACNLVTHQLQFALWSEFPISQQIPNH